MAITKAETEIKIIFLSGEALRKPYMLDLSIGKLKVLTFKNVHPVWTK